MNRSIPTSKVLACVFALLGLVTMSAGVAYGQAISGNIAGTVVDSSGAAVANADVNATNINTGVPANTKTNNTGEYRFDNLLAGFYKITVKASGFRTTTVQVEVQLNVTATANLSVSPGAANEVVEVSGEAPIIDTTTPQIQSTYENKQLQDLPSASSGGALGSGVLNLSLLQSGVASTGGLGAGSGPAVGGQRPRNNNFTVEGVDNNDKGVTGPLAYIPNDAVQNFTILQNQFNAEFGHSNGGQFNTVVLGGTNSFHGMAYEYFRNRNLNAVDTSLANQGIFSNPRYDNNRFGGQVGGPIFKNKLFFFVNYEYNPVGEAASPGSPLLAPTEAGYTTALAVPGVSTANLNALHNFMVAPSACTAAQVTAKICPQANATTGQLAGNVLVGGVNVPVGVFPLAAPTFLNNKALTTSMDWNISDKDQIRGRYIYDSLGQLDTGLLGVTLPAFFTTETVPDHLIAISEYHTFSPTISNEFRFGFNRNGFVLTVPGLTFLPTLDQFPNLTFDELGGSNVGPDPNAPQFGIQNLYQAVDNVTWVKGAHTLKVGVEGRRYISPQKFIQRSRGDYEYGTFNEFAFDQVPDFGQRSFGSAGYSGDQYGVYWYVNDIWKLRRNFTLNLGVRYEYTSTPFGWTQQSLNSVANVPGLITFGSPQAPTHDFMPRVGFAYSPGSSGNTSIRGGFGMGYDVLYDNIGVLSRPPQIGSTANCPGTACGSPFLATGGIKPVPSSGITILDPADARANTSSFLPNNVKYPYSESWNIGVQHVFKSNYTAEVRYVGTRGVNLNVQNIIDFVPGVNGPNLGPGQDSNVPFFLNAPSAAVANGLTVPWASALPSCNQPFNPAKGTGNANCPQGAGDYCSAIHFDTNGNPVCDVPATISASYNDISIASSNKGGGGGFFSPQFVNAGFFSPITTFAPWGASVYHGLQAQLNRRFTNGLQFQAAYTFSHTIDNSTADFFSTIVSPRRPQDFLNLPAERANSILDHRHRVTISAIYDMPFYKSSSSWMKRNVLGNYEIAPVYTWESGQWGTVQSGQDANLNADAAPDRAIFNAAGTKGVGSDVNPVLNNTACGLPPCIVGWAAANPSAQYIVAGMANIATSSRNTLSTPPINNFDASVSKHIALTERYRIDFLFQALNLLNHPQYTTGSLNDVGGNFGITGQGQRNYFIPSAQNFAVPKQSFASNARVVALGLKFIF